MTNQSIRTMYAWNKGLWPTGGTERAFLLLEVTGDAGEKRAARAPMNVSLVLDRSGSMSGEPLEYSKKACQFVAEQMGANDQLSLVAFDNHVQTVLAPQPVTNKDAIKHKISAIHPGGSTSLSGGLLQGIEYVSNGKKASSVNRVILLSDGHANVGITDRGKLEEIAKEFHSAGIGITAMGVGNGFDEELMEGIADNGGGNFYFIEKPEDIPGIFAQELDGLLSVVAQNVRLTIRPANESAVTVNQIFGYAAEETDRGLEVSLGDVYDQEVKSILLEVTLPPHTTGKHDVLSIQWSYMDVTDGAELCSLDDNIEAEFTNDIDLIMDSLNPHVEKQVKITESALAIQHAIGFFDSGDEESGKKLLQAQADTLLRSALLMEDKELYEEARMLYSKLENFEYSRATRKSLHEQNTAK